LAPQQAMYERQRGDALSSGGQIIPAIHAYVRATTTDPAAADVCERLGWLYGRHLNDSQAAARWFVRCIRSAPETSNAYLGLCMIALNGGTDAEEARVRVLEWLGRLDCPARLNQPLARALDAAGRYTEARRYWAAPPLDV